MPTSVCDHPGRGLVQRPASQSVSMSRITTRMAEESIEAQRALPSDERFFYAPNPPPAKQKRKKRLEDRDSRELEEQE